MATENFTTKPSALMIFSLVSCGLEAGGAEYVGDDVAWGGGRVEWKSEGFLAFVRARQCACGKFWRRLFGPWTLREALLGG
ncbi:hypothetical protein CMUS01_03684 [Colletotrichum musicola]|uniref:Secreted protein n=1 Tax=Colletotrichum musicola TaxID=2175873 RepID=A0A8H6U5T8_9PEZI|nr:hypothetical protein CMUS01_03684 [Colletotrichum musicola]